MGKFYSNPAIPINRATWKQVVRTDWAHWIAGREEVEAAGGRVLALALEPGYSTTSIVEALSARQP